MLCVICHNDTSLLLNLIMRAFKLGSEGAIRSHKILHLIFTKVICSEIVSRDEHKACT